MTEGDKTRPRVLAARKRQERLDRFRDEYGERGVAILDLLVRYDPAGLVKSGAPPVQYTTDAGPVCQTLLNAESLEDARCIVQHVLNKCFQECGEASDPLVRAIWSAWNRSNT